MAPLSLPTPACCPHRTNTARATRCRAVVATPPSVVRRPRLLPFGPSRVGSHLKSSSDIPARWPRPGRSAQLGPADRLRPVDARTAVARSTQPRGQNAIANAKPERLADARRRMRRRERVLTANAHSRDGRSSGWVGRRPLRTRQAEANIKDEVKPGGRGTHPEGEPLASVTGAGDTERARVPLPASGEAAQRGLLAATATERQAGYCSDD